MAEFLYRKNRITNAFDVVMPDEALQILHGENAELMFRGWSNAGKTGYAQTVVGGMRQIVEDVETIPDSVLYLLMQAYSALVGVYGMHLDSLELEEE